MIIQMYDSQVDVILGNIADGNGNNDVDVDIDIDTASLAYPMNQLSHHDGSSWHF